MAKNILSLHRLKRYVAVFPVRFHAIWHANIGPEPDCFFGIIAQGMTYKPTVFYAVNIFCKLGIGSLRYFHEALSWTSCCNQSRPRRRARVCHHINRLTPRDSRHLRSVPASVLKARMLVFSRIVLGSLFCLYFSLEVHEWFVGSLRRGVPVIVIVPPELISSQTPNVLFDR